MKEKKKKKLIRGEKLKREVPQALGPRAKAGNGK